MSKRKSKKHKLKNISQLEALQSVRKPMARPSFPLDSKKDKAKRARNNGLNDN
jgi:hypothetical protein